ncbi:MAG: response regulator transcription factor [Methylobacteriaceae bacterium]|nr:response regulator transcription factor [Methylobacteriaceae bacterium]
MSERAPPERADAPARPADDAAHLLIVDDDRRIRLLLSRFLTEHGYRVTVAENAGEARKHLRSLAFDLIVLDVMMPGENGVDFARALRAGSDVPILMLTARSDPGDRVAGLEAGVDDYLAKPFETRELLLRIASILRRAQPKTPRAETPNVRFGPFVFNIERGELRQGEEIVRLTDREREMLTLLARADGESVSREALAGSGGAANERTVDVQVNRLRRKIEQDPANPQHLQTARGAGYRLATER